MSKSQEKKSTFFPKYFQQNRHFLKKIQIFKLYVKTFIADSRSILKQCINIIHYNALNKIYTKGIKYKFS